MVVSLAPRTVETAAAVTIQERIALVAHHVATTTAAYRARCFPRLGCWHQCTSDEGTQPEVHALPPCPKHHQPEHASGVETPEHSKKEDFDELEKLYNNWRSALLDDKPKDEILRRGGEGWTADHPMSPS
jgi:hypothetical protein